MPAKGYKKTPGKRYTKPRTPVRPLRDDEAHVDDVLAGIRQAATPGRLRLEGGEEAPIPQRLQQVRCVCDNPELTSFGGMVPFARFAHGAGVADIATGLPIPKRDSTYSPGKLAEVTVMALAAGLPRISHVDHYTDDPGLCSAADLDRLPDQGTLSRFYSSAPAQAVSFLRDANHRMSHAVTKSLRRQKYLVVDIDTRVVGVYGKQEGSERSPRNGGKPHFTFEMATLRSTYDIIDGGLLEGVTHPGPLFAERLRLLVDLLNPLCDELVICADAAWFSSEVFKAIEALDADPSVPCGCKYAIRAQLRSRHYEAIDGIAQEEWTPCGEDLEMAQYKLDIPGARSGPDYTMRRHIVTRELKRSGSESGKQLSLVEEPRYEYSVIVTNLNWTPNRVRALYNNRTTIESILRESALGFHMDSLPSATFVGNALFSQLLILAYNLTNLFRRLCLPKEHSRHHVQWLRTALLRLPAILQQTDQGIVLHFADKGPHVDLLPIIMQRLQRWIPALATSPPVPA